MGWLKLIISFSVIALWEYILLENGEWNADIKTFEIILSILCAGWIAHNGW